MGEILISNHWPCAVENCSENLPHHAIEFEDGTVFYFCDIHKSYDVTKIERLPVRGILKGITND